MEGVITYKQNHNGSTEKVPFNGTRETLFSRLNKLESKTRCYCCECSPLFTSDDGEEIHLDSENSENKES